MATYDPEHDSLNPEERKAFNYAIEVIEEEILTCWVTKFDFESQEGQNIIASIITDALWDCFEMKFRPDCPGAQN